jgi:hypothetical protein
MMQGMTSHHLLPCCAASRPRTPDTPTEARLTGSRQFGNGGTKILPSRTVLTIPSFPERVMLTGPKSAVVCGTWERPAFKHLLNFLIAGKLAPIGLVQTLLDFLNLPLFQFYRFASSFSRERHHFTPPRTAPTQASTLPAPAWSRRRARARCSWSACCA